MRRELLTIAAAALIFGGCNKAPKQQSMPNPGQAEAARSEAPPIPLPGTGPDARTPFGKPESTVDPRNSEAAADLVRGFVDALNAREFGDAWMLLGPGAPPKAGFERQYSRYANLKVRADTLEPQEGAAGSVYVSVPIEISGAIDGREEHRSAKVVLRRLNDIPGLTEAQRHWHIERVEWGSAG